MLHSGWALESQSQGTCQIYVSGEAMEIPVIGELGPQLATDTDSGLARTRNGDLAWRTGYPET